MERKYDIKENIEYDIEYRYILRFKSTERLKESLRKFGTEIKSFMIILWTFNNS